jgi:drug/metabolite transporter (DMT)-like permease
MPASTTTRCAGTLPLPARRGITLAPAGARSLAAFGAIYLIWGTTYLAIRYGVASIPPYLMTGTRCLVAGGALFAWSARRGDPRPTARAWAAALVVGALLFVAGQGLLAWAETRVASGPAALLIATVPLWMVLLAWARPGGAAPSARVWAGIAVGLAGVLLLFGVGPGGEHVASGGDAAGAGGTDPVGAAAILLAALSWALGSSWARGTALPASRTQSAGMQLLMAGAVMLVLSIVLGEAGSFAPAAVATRSWLALAYLIVFGSIVAFSAYLWLLDHATPARVGSHAYVNPVIAVFVAALAGDGVLTGRTFLAAAAVVAAVTLTMEGS